MWTLTKYHEHQSRPSVQLQHLFGAEGPPTPSPRRYNHALLTGSWPRRSPALAHWGTLPAGSLTCTFSSGTGLPLVTQFGVSGPSHWSLEDMASLLPGPPPWRQAQRPLPGPRSASMNFVLPIPAHPPGAPAKPAYTPPTRMMGFLDQ